MSMPQLNFSFPLEFLRPILTVPFDEKVAEHFLHPSEDLIALWKLSLGGPTDRVIAERKPVAPEYRKYIEVASKL